MASWPARESAKQALCREQNESAARAHSAASIGGRENEFLCECGDLRCGHAITLTLSEYEHVREEATHFALAPNHENPERESVVQENARFAIVEMVTGEAMKLARRTDPRLRRRERCIWGPR